MASGHSNKLSCIESIDLFKLKPVVSCIRLVIAGGLIAGNSLPVYADLPVPSPNFVTSGSVLPPQVTGDTMLIKQETDKAILNWQSFNVGAKNTVQFVQPGSSSIALNRIHQADPSQIFGQIKANGQIYLYNQNGFVFGKDSVVNANSVLASTLNITDEVFNSGITRVFDDGGKAALAIEPQQPGSSLDPKTASILIDAGAKIHVEKNGRIIISAPTIENKGSLSADEQGQIILVASQDKVYLQPADKNSPFAGLLVEVDTGGKVTNAGDILVRQGNATLEGFAVNQNGRVTATTSVNVNGSIRLVAEEAHGIQGNTLVATKTSRAADKGDGLGTKSKLKFGSGSVTQVIADNDGGAAIDEQSQPQSYVQAKAHTVALESNAAVVVPGGKVDITATDNLISPTQGTSGRVFMDKGASIDVSGEKGVSVAMERNVGEISVQSYELRDAPLQKTGVLKGETVRVDLRKDTNIIDTSGAVARIQRGIKERLSKGGEIKLTSSGDIVINDGAKLNISGGSVNYRSGYISTTKLLTDYGKIVDISDADPNQHYVSIFGVVKEVHTKWGTERVWNTLEQFGKGKFEQGYREGKDAGSLNIQAPNLLMNGDLIAGSDAGPYQRLPGLRPDGGSFVFDSSVFPTAFTDVRFQSDKSSVSLGLDDPIPRGTGDKPQAVVLSTQLFNQSGIQHLTVKTRGDASLTKDADVRMVPGGEFSLQAGAIDVQGRIHAAGGSIDLAIAQTLGDVHLGASSVLDVSGRWINDLQQGLSAVPVDPLYLDGGSVKVHSVGDLYFEKGAKISADGGAWLAQNGKLSAGKGGSIDLAAVGLGTSSAVHLDGKLSAVGISEGGSLTLDSGEIILGNGDSKTTDPLRLAVKNGVFAFDPESGFGAIKLLGNLEGVTVGSDVNLNLKTRNLVLNSDYLQKASADSIRPIANMRLLPEHLRQPFALSLAGTRDVVVATGSSIVTDVGSTVSLASSLGSIYVDGRIAAPAGTINVSINPVDGSEYDPSQNVRLGSHAELLAQGATLLNPIDVLGRRTGEVLDGGQVHFDLKRGYFIAEQGSLIDVSGTHAVLDLPSANKGTGEMDNVYVPADVASNAGGIAIMVAEGAVLDGSMRGFAGSDSTRSGSLSLTLDNSHRQPPDFPLTPFPKNPLTIHVRENQQTLFDSNIKFGDVIPDSYNGQMVVAADTLDKGGFGDVRLSALNEIRFAGDVNLSAKARLDLDASKISWAGLNGATSGTVNLNTAFLRMGSSQTRTVNTLPLAGEGVFNAHAQWIELFGATRWDGFSHINLNSAHDLRAVGIRAGADRDFLGAMVTASDLNLNASQIYPATLSNFTFAVRNNPNGKINITGANTDQSPLSAAGVLNFEAPVINQSGVIKAPLGTINLKAGSQLTFGENSLTSVSAAGQVIPFGVTQGGLDWLYPLDSIRNLVFNTPPEKRLLLQAPEVVMAKGSTVDLSGGGDLYAYEFLPGSGGSYDYLQPGSGSYQGGFAILPGLGANLAPYDPYQYASGGVEFGKQVYLSGTDNLPAGIYTVLPAHYALLPGAFLVTPQANTQDQTLTTKTIDGLSVVAGYELMAGTGTRDARWSGFRIESGADIRKHSQYEEHLANDFYSAKALKNETAVPVLPKDSGQISIIAQTKLMLDSEFMVDALSGGRGARMDIASDNIAVVGQLSATPTAGTLEILDTDLSGLKIDSLLLGGARSFDATSGETKVSVNAKQVVFGEGSKVHVSDMIVAATNRIDVQNGAALAANGSVNTGDKALNITGNGALLRISGDKQVTLNRTNASGVTGELNIAAGSTLSASESMLLDASKSTQLSGDILMQGGSLSLSATTINLGEVDNLGGNALNLSNLKLRNLAVDELVLTGRDSVGIYGNLGRVDDSGLPVLGSDGLQNPIQFKSLVINTAGFTGHGAAGDQAGIQAGSLRLQNTFAALNHQTADGHGQLNLSGDSVEIGNGNFTLQGFNGVAIDAGNEFRLKGTGNLNVAADLNVATPALTADGGADIKLNAAGHNVQFAALTTAKAVGSGFGAAFNVIGDAISFDTKALLPSGSFGFHSTSGDVTIGSQAQLDLGGSGVAFADKTEYTPGGDLKITADHGKVILAAGSTVNLDSGGGKAPGGQLTLQAPEQSIALLGQLKASGGSATLDVGDFDVAANFDALMNKLGDAGINHAIDFRTRTADIVQAADSSINAQIVTLSADRGAISLAGAIKADAAGTGGQIKLYAGDGITLENGSTLTAKGLGSDAKGGSVLLSSVDADNDNVSGINLKAGSVIDVRGGTAGNGGEVTLRALRSGNGVNIQPLAGSVKGASHFYAEGVKKYSDANGIITSADIDKIKADTDAYMTPANMLAVTNTLGGGIRLRPGVEIDYKGDLVLQDKWDLVDWRYNEGTGLSDLPGTLSLNASGKIILNASISDAFKDGTLYYDMVQVKDMLQSGDSWSYQVTAGSDLAAADRAMTSANKNLVIGPDVSVRTGTGDIGLVSGGNIVFTNDTSTVYSAGRPTDADRFGTLQDLSVAFQFYSEYPVDGGDLVMKAGGDIQGAATNQFISPWLVRQGNWTTNANHAEEVPTAWGVALGYLPADQGIGNVADADAPLFRQNVGSFGGGKVEVSASGNINDLSVMMPTTGKQIGQPVADPHDPNPSSLDFITNEVQVQGGGEMRISAGGNIAGGAYFLGQGQGSLTADGAIKGGSQFVAGPQLVMGDAQIDLVAKKDLSLAGVSDAMVLNSGDTNFFTYGDASAVSASALAGNVHLNSDLSVIDKFVQLGDNQKKLAGIYPGTLQSTAFGGSVMLDNQIILFPSAQGALNLSAVQDITSKGDTNRLGMSDADRSLLPSALLPVARNNMSDAAARLNPFGLPALVHAATPLHAGDSEPARLVTNQGDIKNIQFSLAKKALVQTGRDFKNVLLLVQHANSNDGSLLNIGRDLVYTSDRSSDGALINNPNKIEISGSGEVLVKAGRNVDLGASGGLSTLGNLVNPVLVDRGANISVMAGLNGKEPDYIAFIDKYLVGSETYAAGYAKVSGLITDFMREHTGNPLLSATDALAGFKTLKAEDYLEIQPRLNALILPVYMNEIRESGSASAGSGNLGNERGYAAIETLFPGSSWKGDLSLYFSKVQTLDGGDINLLVPGGQVNAGLAVAFTGAKKSSELGIVAQKDGAVNAVVNGDFLVNQSRVFALDGGDITLWSSNGDIDAGRGAKSAIDAPPPVASFDKNGNLQITFPPIVSGSGIRTAASSSGTIPGDVFLFAPKGVVNAGEAGIGGTNVTISATAVLGANNIQVSGIGTGVPVASTGSLAAGLTGTSNLTASVSQVAQAATGVDNDDTTEKAQNAALGMLSVDVIGIGESDPEEKNSPQQKRSSRSTS